MTTNKNEEQAAAKAAHNLEDLVDEQGQVEQIDTSGTPDSDARIGGTITVDALDDLPDQDAATQQQSAGAAENNLGGASKLQRASRQQMKVQMEADETGKASSAVPGVDAGNVQGDVGADYHDQAYFQVSSDENEKSSQDDEEKGFRAADDAGTHGRSRFAEKRANPFEPKFTTRFQAALLTSILGEADCLQEYVCDRICDRRHYIQEWSGQCKRSSFLAHFIEIMVPRLKDMLEHGTEPTCKGFAPLKLIQTILTLIDSSREFYNYRYHNTAIELLDCLRQFNQVQFGIDRSNYHLNEDYWQRQYYSQSIYFLNTIEHFSRADGLTVLAMIVDDESNQLEQYQTLHFRGYLLHVATQLKEFLRVEHYCKFAERLRESNLAFVRDKLGESLLRGSTVPELRAFISLHESLLSAISRHFLRQAAYHEEHAEEYRAKYNFTDYVYYWTERLELELALRCLRMPVLEKKFFALQLLADKVAQVQRKHMAEQSGLAGNAEQSNKGPVSANEATSRMGIGVGRAGFAFDTSQRKRWLSRDTLIEWLQDKQVFQLIFGESLHVEVLKKSLFLLDFMQECGRIGEPEIGLMWECASEKHEAYRVAILRAMTHLATKASSKSLRLLFERLKSSPLSQIDKTQLVLLRTLAKSASTAIVGFDVGERRKQVEKKINYGQHTGSSRVQFILDDVADSGGRRARKTTMSEERQKESKTKAPRLASDSPTGRRKTSVQQPFQLKEQRQTLDKWSVDGDSKPRQGRAQRDEDEALGRVRGSSTPARKSARQKRGGRGMSSDEGDYVAAGRAADLEGSRGRTRQAKLIAEELLKDKVTRNTSPPLAPRGHMTEQDLMGMEDPLAQRLAQRSGVKMDDDGWEVLPAELGGPGQIETGDAGAEPASRPALDEPEEGKDHQEALRSDGSRDQKTLSLKSLLFDMQLAPKQDDDQESVSMKKLASEILRLLWQFATQSTLNRSGDQDGVVNLRDEEDGQPSQILPMNIQLMAIECLCQVLNYYLPQSAFFFMGACVKNISGNQATVASQMILQRLIDGVSYPIAPDLAKGKASQIETNHQFTSLRLPKNKSELVQALDADLNLINECLASHVEFKRTSVQQIFDRFRHGSDAPFGFGGVLGDQDENLETQSSLDNTQQTGEEERSGRFSRSIVSSTQKSDKDTLDAPGGDRSATKMKMEASDNEMTFSQRQESLFLTDSKQTKTMNEGSQEADQQTTLITNGKDVEDKEVKNSQDIAEVEEEAFSPLPNLKQTTSQPVMGSRSRLVVSAEKPIAQVISEDDETSGDQLCAQQTQKDGLMAKNEHGALAVNTHDYQSQQQSTNRAFLEQLITERTMQLNYLQEMTRRLDFFLYLHKHSNAKLLTLEHINILWECLVINAFNEQERDNFFSLCSELLATSQLHEVKKMIQQTRQDGHAAGSSDNEAADDLLFSEDTFELIFFEILLKLDYKGSDANGSGGAAIFTPNMYQCFERFFIYVNEKYGQIMQDARQLQNLAISAPQQNLASQMPTQFEVHTHELVGIEALWEIVLSAPNQDIYQKSSSFLSKLYKKLLEGASQADREVEGAGVESSIKELIYQNCLTQIRQGVTFVHKTNQEYLRGSRGLEIMVQEENFENLLIDVQKNLHPNILKSATIDESKSRITRSIQILSRFIKDFEGLKTKEKKKQDVERMLTISINNQMPRAQSAPMITLVVPQSMKVGELKEQIADNLNEDRVGSELSILFRGKDLTDDLKTLKDVGMKPPLDARDPPIKLMLTLKTPDYLGFMDEDTGANQVNNEQLNEALENLKMFLGDLPSTEEVCKLALKKNNLDLQEALMMLTDPEKLVDLADEVAQEAEANQVDQLLTKAEPAANDAADEEAANAVPEQKLNEMVSNRPESFNLLFGLLNLGIPSIAQASWQLLTQVPVNQQLLNKIKLLNKSEDGPIVEMTRSEWSEIIEPQSVHKMLYSLQLVSQLITVNSDKLSEQEVQERLSWRQRFLELGGFDHLYYVFSTYNLDLAVKRAPEQESIEELKANEVSNSNLRTDRKIEAQCLSHLVSIIKVFLQAAIISKDERNRLLNLIASSSTSPFKKGVLPAAGLGIASYGGESSSAAASDKDTSSVHTAQFGNSFSQPAETGPPTGLQDLDRDQDVPITQSGQGEKAKKPIGPTMLQGLADASGQNQVDDFPKLIDQLSSNGLSRRIIDIVNFEQFIQKLLEVVEVCVCELRDIDAEEENNEASSNQFKQRQASQQISIVPALVQNTLDLMLPCLLWSEKSNDESKAPEPESYMHVLTSFKTFERLLIAGLTKNGSEVVRESLEGCLRLICQQDQKQSPTVVLFLSKILVNNLSRCTIFKRKTSNGKVRKRDLGSTYFEEYFGLLCSLVKLAPANYKDVEKKTAQEVVFYDEQDKKFNTELILNFCIENIEICQKLVLEQESNSSARLLSVYLHLAQALLEVRPNLKSSSASALISSITDFLLSTDKEKISASKVDRSTRRRAYALLVTLCDKNEENYERALSIIYKFYGMVDRSWRAIDKQELEHQDIGIKQATGYVGLKNFGCTCYMNSLLQQLYMIPDIRNAILSFDFGISSESDTEENALRALETQLEDNTIYQLQTVFANLQESERSYFIPNSFVKSFKFYGEPVNVRVQQDTTEFYNVLCEQIEQLSGKKGQSDAEAKDGAAAEDKKQSENFLWRNIGGKICHETSSLEPEYPYVGERDEDFYAITLDIKDKKTLEEALNLYVKPDVLDGDNKYHCEEHDRKISAQRRTYLKDLSNTVCLVLKRFEYDYNTMTRHKLNDYCEFPEVIDFRPWTKAGVQAGARKDKDSKAAPDSSPIDDDVVDLNDDVDKVPDEPVVNKPKKAIIDEDVYSEHARSVDSNIAAQGPEVLLSEQKSTSKEEIDEQQYVYQLSGVLVHSGGADAGHYYSYIKERNRGSPNYGKWFEFNDTKVTEFDLRNLKKECFGGQQQYGQKASDGYSNVLTYERCCNAYVIFYEKVKKEDVVANDQQNQLQHESVYMKRIVQRIHEQNLAFKHLRIFQEPDFVKFMTEYVQLCSFQEVLYFDQALSDSWQVVKMRELTHQYVMEWEEQMRKAKRKQQTQALRGFEVTPVAISMSEKRDYLQEQRQIRANAPLAADIFANQSQNGVEDTGLRAIQLATIFACDVVLKLRDSAKFVQLATRLGTMFQAHAAAACWFIKWVTVQQNIVQEVLLASPFAEVREAFAQLISTAFGVCVINEERYLGEFEKHADFERCDRNVIDQGGVPYRSTPRSAAVRVAKLLSDQMMHCARVHWRNFDEFFILMRQLAQSHHLITEYFISRQGLISALVEFVLNGNGPNDDRQTMRMGDSLQSANFGQAYCLLAYLIRCCLTNGINIMKRYSPLSVHQSEDKKIILPDAELQQFLTPIAMEEVLGGSYMTDDLQIQSISEIIMHLSWGDATNGWFFTREITRGIRLHKRQAGCLQYFLNIADKLLNLGDARELQAQRYDTFLQFGYDDQQIENQHALIFQHMFKVRDIYPLYFLLLANFVARSAVTEQGNLISDRYQKIKDCNDYFRGWMGRTLQDCLRSVDGSLMWASGREQLRLDQGQLQRIIVQTAEIFGKMIGVSTQVMLGIEEQPRQQPEERGGVFNDDMDFIRDLAQEPVTAAESKEQKRKTRQTVEVVGDELEGIESAVASNDQQHVGGSDDIKDVLYGAGGQKSGKPAVQPLNMAALANLNAMNEAADKDQEMQIMDDEAFARAIAEKQRDGEDTADEEVKFDARPEVNLFDADDQNLNDSFN